MRRTNTKRGQSLWLWLRVCWTSCCTCSSCITRTGFLCSVPTVVSANSLCLFLSLFFFFQAEDGIRDHCVTGVQTCALPICGGGGHPDARERGDGFGGGGREPDSGEAPARLQRLHQIVRALKPFVGGLRHHLLDRKSVV